MRDIIKKLPKLRGFGKNRAKTVNNSAIAASVVNVTALESAFANGDAVNPVVLVAKGLVASRSKRAPKVKILGTGALTKKLTVTNCTVSATAKATIEKAGGTVA
jgi:large subunit ribosomal protein L15